MSASTGMAILAWFCIYLIVTCVFSTCYAVLAFIYEVFPTELMKNLLFLFSLGVPVVLMGIGVVSALPLSEYAYMRQAGRNPAIARETVRHQKRKPEKRELGIVLGVVGITTAFGISPWQGFFFLLEPLLGIPTITILMVAFLMLLVRIYRKSLNQYVEFS